MNLKKIKKLTKKIVTEEKIDEETFDYVYEKLTFVTKRLYLLCLKVLIVFMYLFITIETFIRNRSDLTEASFPHLLEFLILAIGPYAVSFFLKTDKGDFLSSENKYEIKQNFIAFNEERVKSKSAEVQPSETHKKLRRDLSVLYRSGDSSITFIDREVKT